MNGEFIDVLSWRNGLIEVDLMPMLVERIIQIRDERIPFDIFVVGKSIVLSLDSSIRAEDVINKESCILT